MNKNLIALAVAAAAFSGAASAATVFSNDTSSVDVNGRIETAAVVSNHDTSNDGQNKARITFTGKTQIADGINAIGSVEKDFAAKDEDSIYNSKTKKTTTTGEDFRKLYVGVANANNQLVYGKTDGSLGMITDFTDIMSFGGDAAGGKIAAGDRTTNNLAYVGTFNNLTVKANYVFDGGKSTTDANNHQGYSAAVKYAMDNGLALGAGYGAQNNGVSKDNNEQVFAGVSYTLGNLYFGALFNDSHRYDLKNADDKLIGHKVHQRGYEYAASYTMGKTVFTTTYNFLESIHNGDAANTVYVNQAGVDATYYFNPNFRAYVGYTAFLGSVRHTHTVDGDHNQFALGARYDF